MAKLTKEMIKKLNAAEPTGGGNFVQHGRYLFIVENFIQKPDGYNGASVIVELFVVRSASAADGKNSGAPPNPKGSKASVVFNLTGGQGGAKAASAALGNLKGCIQNGLLGKTDYDAWMSDPAHGADGDERLGNLLDLLEQEARGAMMTDETYLSKIKSGQRQGQDIVNHRWGHIEVSEEQRKKNLDILDGKLAPEEALSVEESVAA